MGLEHLDDFEDLRVSVTDRLLSAGFVPSIERDEHCQIELEYFTRSSHKDAPSIILVSGTHGVEYRIAGIVFGERCVREIELLPMNITIVPFLNTHGAINLTRENRNGIDLNRNYRRSFSTGPATVKLGRLGFFAAAVTSTVRALASALRHGHKETLRRITMGQNEDRFAPFYFGNGLEDEIRLLEKIFRRLAQNSTPTWYFDFHTGYGSCGKMSLLHLYPDGSERKRMVARLWGEETVFSEGDIVQLFHECFAEKAVLAATVEFGTLPGAYVLASMLADRARDREGTRDEYWKKRFSRIFFPEEKDWAQSCEQQTLHLLSTLREQISKGEY